MFNGVIAKKVGVSEKSARITKLKYETTYSVNESSRSGKLRKLGHREINFIFNQVRVNSRLRNGILAEWLNKKLLGVSACAETRTKNSIVYSA